ncbi:transcription initiation factor TFIID subunit 3 isoform X2 [Bombina bombina]|uniref:transcription initiation factor TFIID subunit 3 isoform X2 n=1 Tax=Bombina bombina TaxID=8345 RepID=UPI00235B07B5|nr:transcription initiation factor TFIID subunit 3 isoform X2 [Bombina bombina]
MCESYTRSLLRVSVAQICQALGWDSVQLTACDLLTDVLQRYLAQLCRGAHRYTELYGRTDPVLDDIGQAFKLMGVNLHELEDYIHNIEPVTFPHQIPSFPVSKNNVLQFPPSGSKDVEDRKEYIPDYLPLFISSQEEEEEEQVPTDGGTSAEAMQVPLEEEGEMEEDETINDENCFSKRPLDSPETIEMPFAKRPRLGSTKGDILDGTLEPREPLSSINSQKVPPILSPFHVQDNPDLAVYSEQPAMSVSKSIASPSKSVETKSLTPKTKAKGSSPAQKTKSPKSTPLTPVLGSPIRSPKTGPKEKKSPGRAKSPRSPKSPKVGTATSQLVVKAETPSRTPLATLSEKVGKENIQVKQTQAMSDSEKLNVENSKKPPVAENTIEDSIDAVIARACAEQEPDPFEFSSGTESEGEVLNSSKRLTISEPQTPKVSSSSSSLGKVGNPPLPPSGGTSSSDISWTMDDSINEVIRKVNQETPPTVPSNAPCFSSPSASPPTPEPLFKTFEEKSKLASPVEIKKKTKKELKAKMKKKDKEKQKDKDKEKEKSKEKNKEKNKEKDKEKDVNKETKLMWKDAAKDEDAEAQRFKIKDLNDLDMKSKQKENSGKNKEKHKDKKKDKEKGKKKEKGKDKNKEDKLKTPSTPIVLSSKEISLPMISTPNSARIPVTLFPAMSPLLPEKLFDEKEKGKEKKKDKKEKKKKKDKEKGKEKEKEKKEKEKKDKEKDKHKHEKVKVDLSVPAPSPVIPRLTLRVGAGEDKIVISKVVSAPEAKQAPATPLPKSPPPPAPSPAPAPVLVVPPPVPQAPAAAAASPAPNPVPPASGASAGNAKGPVRSVVTETVSTYVIRDEWGNQIWICPGCNKADDGSPMIGCDGCDDWYHWPCVGISDEPPENEQWFCTTCFSKKKDKKHKKRKHKAH